MVQPERGIRYLNYRKFDLASRDHVPATPVWTDSNRLAAGKEVRIAMVQDVRDSFQLIHRQIPVVATTLNVKELSKRKYSPMRETPECIVTATGIQRRIQPGSPRPSHQMSSS